MTQEEKIKHQQDLLFECLQITRHLLQKNFSDWKDADDWLFSELSITKDELNEIYTGHDALVYGVSCR